MGYLAPSDGLALMVRLPWWRWAAASAAASGVWWIAIPALAQVIPDDTLGAESSVVQQVDAVTQHVEGGATRGGNLFHSFTEFNVGAGNAIYFNPDAGIDSILSRVTGNNPSHIVGRLGVVGSADLFLLNPNGFVFGENATLDVNGAFHAIAAPALPLETGVFSAVAPQSNSLLTVSPDVSLFNYLTGGDITSTAQLQAGQGLTLAADNLQLQGQLVAGGDLNLLATESVTVRDTVTDAFVASAGGDLTIQSNQLVDIFALNQPDSGLFALGDLTLRSDNPIIGDAHFFSGGNWNIERLDGSFGSLISPNDPVILAAGNVQLGAYTGASLHILAGGSVTLTDDITITGTGPVASTINPSNTTVVSGSGLTYADLATFQVPDYDVVVNANGPVSRVPTLRTINVDGNAEATLDVRAGVDWAALGGLITNPTVAGTVTPTYPAGGLGSGITVIGDVRIDQPDGLVVLTNQFQPNGSLAAGTISVQGIDAHTEVTNSNGGDITIVGRSDISVAGNLYSSSVSTSFSSLDAISGNGGEILLVAEGNIDVGLDLITYSEASSFISANSFSGNGGDILLFSARNIDVEGGLDSRSFSDSSSVSVSSAASGNGGRIIVLSEGSIDVEGALESSSTSKVAAVSNSVSSSISGSGGDIVLFSEGNIDLQSLLSSSRSLSSSSSVSGNGGDIALFSEGNLDVESGVDSFSFSFSDSSLPSGSSSVSGNGGDIALFSEGNLDVESGVNSFSFSDSVLDNEIAGAGGTITLNASQGSIRGINGELLAIAVVESGSGTTGGGGAVQLDARDQISGLQVLTLASGGPSGNIAIQGLGDLLVQDVSVTASAQIEIQNPFGGFIVLDTSGFGTSGNADITSVGTLTIDNSEIRSDANGTRPGGQISIDGASEVTFNNSALLSDTNNIGTGGDIILRNLNRLTFNNSTITTDTAGFAPASHAGDIQLQNVGPVIMQNGSLILVSAENNAQAGDITISADALIATPDGNNDIIANAVGGNGGRIDASGTPIVLNFTERDGFTVGQLRGLSSNDISASSSLAADGIVDATFSDSPEADELPGNFLNADNLIAGSCINPENRVAGNFTIPGSGGLPYAPDDSATSVYETSDVQVLPSTAVTPTNEPWQLGDEIVEPEIAAQLADGRIVLGRSCTGAIGS